MSHTIYMGYAGLRSRAEALEVIGHNLANLQSVGFKQQQYFFEVLDSLRDPDLTMVGSAINGPVVRTRDRLDFSSGVLQETGNPLDCAFNGDGFFVVETAEGRRFTRNGHFTLGPKGDLLTVDGHRVLGIGGEKGEKPINLPPGTVTIAPNGQISVDGVVTATLKVVAFDDLSVLSPAGAALFRAEEGASEIPPERLAISQGFLEEANVNAMESVSEMITLLRSFEMLTQAVRAINREVDQRLINDLARV